MSKDVALAELDLEDAARAREGALARHEIGAPRFIAMGLALEQSQ